MRARAQQVVQPGITATVNLAALVALPRAPASSKPWRMLSIQSESSLYISKELYYSMQILLLKTACKVFSKAVSLLACCDCR